MRTLIVALLGGAVVIGMSAARESRAAGIIAASAVQQGSADHYWRVTHDEEVIVFKKRQPRDADRSSERDDD